MTAPESVDPAGVWREQIEAASPALLRAMVKTFADALMSAEADAVCGAGYGERSEQRVNSRNGYRAREWDTRGRHRRAGHPEAALRLLLPGLVVAAPPPRRAGAGQRGGDQLSAGGVDPAGGEVGRAAGRGASTGASVHTARAALRRFRAGHVPDAKSPGLEPKTVRNVHIMLHTALATAVKWSYATDNVAEHVRPPRVPRRKPTVWTPAQLRQFLIFI